MLGGPGTARDWSTTFECFTCGFQGRLDARELWLRLGIELKPLRKVGP